MSLDKRTQEAYERANHCAVGGHDGCQGADELAQADRCVLAVAFRARGAEVARLESEAAKLSDALRKIERQTHNCCVHDTIREALKSTPPPAAFSGEREALEIARKAKDALFEFWLYSRPTGHGCSELIRQNYGAEHPMAGDCKYCFYGRMNEEARRDIGHRLQNEWADAEHKADAIRAGSGKP